MLLTQITITPIYEILTTTNLKPNQFFHMNQITIFNTLWRVQIENNITCVMRVPLLVALLITLTTKVINELFLHDTQVFLYLLLVFTYTA